jgi:hypothetical protein
MINIASWLGTLKLHQARSLEGTGQPTDRLRETGMHDMGLVFTTEILFRPRAGTESS